MKLLKKILISLIIPLMFVTKVIDKPLSINFSPADIILIIIGLFIIKDFIKNRNYRKELLNEKSFVIFIVLIMIKILSSVVSYHQDVVTLDKIDATISNIKFIVSVLYFTVGFFSVSILDEKKVFIVIYISSLIFVIVGLFGKLVFNFSWTVSGSRMISFSNDPNTAGLVILLGIISGLKILNESDYRVYKIIILISFLFLGSGLFFTGSRTAILSLTLILCILLISYLRTPQKLLIVFSMVFLALSMLLFIDNTYLNSKGYDSFIDRVYYKTESSSEFRYSLIKIANEMGNTHPLTGVGTGNYILNVLDYSEKLGIKVKTAQVAHNTFMSLYAENGILAMILYMLLLISLLYKSRNQYAIMFLMVLLMYSFLFNVENVRLLWFNFGLYLCSTTKKKYLTKRLSNNAVVFISLCSIVLSFILMPMLTIPYSTNGQEVCLTVKDKLTIYMEFRNLKKESLELFFDGPESKKIVINNKLGYYYDELNLIPGDYKLTISSSDSSIQIERFDVITDQHYTIVKKVFSINNLNLIATDEDMKLNMLDNYNIYDKEVKFVEKTITYKSESSGVNFNNQIVLVSSEYLENDDGTVTIKLKFKKTGDISKNYRFLIRAYPVNLIDINKVNELKKTYRFDTPLKEMKINSEFKAEWTFDTNDKVYMIYYGFYHDDATGTITRPYPIWFREGFVK